MKNLRIYTYVCIHIYIHTYIHDRNVICDRNVITESYNLCGLNSKPILEPEYLSLKCE